jgi:hypothetical protein
MTDATPSMLDLVRSLPVQTLQTRITSPRRSSDYTFRGALLRDYVHALDVLPREHQLGGLCNWYYVAKAEDGMTITVAHSEIAPGFSDKPVLLAYEQDGEAIRAGLRLVVPGDGLGGRSIVGVASIEVKSIPHETVEATAHSDGIELMGQLDRPGRLELAALRGEPQTTVDIRAAKTRRGGDHAARQLSGPKLYGLLEAAGIQLDEAIHEHFLRKIVVARSHDGFAVVFAGGELEPRFQNADVIVGLSQDGTPLGPEDGGIRLGSPQDKGIARSLRGLASVEVRDG